MRSFIRNRAGFKSTIKRVAALAIMITITVGSVVTVAAATRNAVIDYNGEKKSVQLFSDETDEILSAAKIPVNEKDLVVRSSQNAPDGSIQLIVRSAYSVNVESGGKIKAVTLHYGDTVAEALAQAGVAPGKNDAVSPAADTQITGATDIKVIKKYCVSIAADGETIPAVVSEGTVAQALDEAGVKVGNDDVVSVKQDTAVGEGMKIAVARVEYQQVTSQKEIPFQNRTEKSAGLYKGQKQIRTPGKSGVKSVVLKQKLVDGKLAGSEEISSTVIAQPVEQVTVVGTKKRAGTVENGDGTFTDRNGKTVSYRKCVSGRCTGYTGGGWTSTGKPAAFGLVAVNPHIIPYGSRLYITSADGRTVYGYAIAADTGGGVMKGVIVADLYFNTVGQCRNFGVRNMNIYVL